MPHPAASPCPSYSRFSLAAGGIASQSAGWRRRRAKPCSSRRLYATWFRNSPPLLALPGTFSTPRGKLPGSPRGDNAIPPFFLPLYFFPLLPNLLSTYSCFNSHAYCPCPSPPRARGGRCRRCRRTAGCPARRRRLSDDPRPQAGGRRDGRGAFVHLAVDAAHHDAAEQGDERALGHPQLSAGFVGGDEAASTRPRVSTARRTLESLLFLYPS